MPNNISQQQNTSGDKSAAALSFATMLSEQLMPKVAPEAPQEPQNAPGSEEAPESKETPQETPPDQNEAKFTDLEAKMDKMKVEMESMMKGEISSIKDIIIEALNGQD